MQDNCINESNKQVFNINPNATALDCLDELQRRLGILESLALAGQGANDLNEGSKCLYFHNMQQLASDSLQLLESLWSKVQPAQH